MVPVLHPPWYTHHGTPVHTHHGTPVHTHHGTGIYLTRPYNPGYTSPGHITRV